ncbi:MAG TPA: YndJ family transporter, partial [Planctomycetota bacterium]|nr:YndJ family transporter [Planctomycetota bacterium]
GGGPAAELAIDAGLVFLAVGGAWTFASRAALPVLGFEEPWCLLTGAHFHFAGLVLPVVAGRASRLAPGSLGALACAGVVAGVPAVAIGITAGARGHGTIEWLAALLLVLATLAVAAQLAWLAARSERLLPGALLAVASLALCGGMALVAVYATTTWLGTPRLSLLDMARTHAPLQVFGFALPALLALHLLPRPEPIAQMQIVLPWLGDVPAPQAFADRPFGPEVAPGARGVATDRHECELPSEPPGPPLPEGPFRRAADAARAYRSFPAPMITGLRAQGPVVAGETVVARYRMLPGLHLVFAARVVEVFDGATDGTHRTGFAYRTLTGHPECGVETFAVEKDLATGRVRAVVSAHSRCGTWLSRRLRPLARQLQLAAGRAAVANLRAIAAGADGSVLQA